MTEDTSKPIAIPLNNTRALGEFIAELLGQRRSIERTFADRRFEIDMTWLLNLDRIIEQRLAAQNAGKLMSFSVSVYFVDGKIVRLESQHAFRSYNDMSNEISVGVDLRWTYLIQFPLTTVPEKQEIRFTAFTDRSAIERKTEVKPSKSFLSFDAESEQLGYSIQFTDVTWGEDLSAHIANYIISKTDAVPKWKNNLRRVRSTILAPLTLLLASLVILWTLASAITVVDLIKQYGPINEISNHLQTADQKIDFLVSATITRLQTDIPVFSPIIRAVSIYAMLAAAMFVLLIRKASFICINEVSRRYLERYGKNFEFIKYGVGAALLIAIIGGVFSNRIYDTLKLWF